MLLDLFPLKLAAGAVFFLAIILVTIVASAR